MPDPASGWGADPAPTAASDPSRPGPLDSDVAVGLLKRGQTLAEQGDWELAAGTFARVVGNEDPALHTAALLGLAECRYRMDDEPAALQAWISATQAPENELTWRAWKALAAARVRSNDVAGAARAYREAARRAPASEQAELQSRIGWLSKEMGDDSGAQRAFGRTRTGVMPQPMVTYGILAITVIISLVVELSANSELGNLLFLSKTDVYFEGEYWRLLTVALVHGGIFHLALNMYALFIIGPIVETLYGPGRFLAIYLICVAAGSAASYATSPNAAVGASAGVFGLFGVLLVADRVHKPALTRNARNLTLQIGMLIGINVLIGLSPGTNIDNAAHIGGLLAGAVLGFLLVPQGATLGSFWSRPSTGPASPAGPPPDPGDRSRPLRLLGVGGLVALIVVVVALSPITYPVTQLLFPLAREPASPTEAVREAIAVPPGETVVVVRKHPTFGAGSERQPDRQRASGRDVRSLVAET